MIAVGGSKISSHECPQIPTEAAASSSSHRQKSRRLPGTLITSSAVDDPKRSNSFESPRVPPPFSPRFPPPTSPSYSGFDGLDRCPISLHDGSVAFYYALPAGYPLGRTAAVPEEEDYWSYLGLDETRGPSAKRKHANGHEYAWLRESVRRYGNPNAGDKDGPDSSGKVRDLVDYGRLLESVRRYGNPNAHGRFEHEGRESERAEREGSDFKEAFFKCVKLINGSSAERTSYLANGMSGPLRCIVCGRTSKAFTDVHDLIVHAYTSETTEFRIDHLGLHKALCVLMGWDYSKVPESSKTYQSLSADAAAANKEDLIVWPPTVIIHNTHTGRRKDGRMEGLSDKEVDVKLKELGFTSGISKSLYGKGGHLGIAAVKFASTPTGLEEAEQLAEYFQKEKHGREGWAHVEGSQISIDEKNPAITKGDKRRGEKNNIFYGYLATASDLEKVDIDTRKKAIIKSRRGLDLSD